MPATYTANLLPLNQIRLLIGDIDTTVAQLQDAEINNILSIEGNVLAAASMCCLVIAAKYAVKVDESLGDHSKSFSQLQTQYVNLARQLRLRQSSKASFPATTNLDPAFTRDM